MNVKGSPLTFTFAGGVLSAFLFLSITLIPNLGMALLASLAPIPLFMVGLALGRRPVIAASLVTTALIFVFAHPIQGISYTLLYALPIIALTDRALLNRKVGKLVEWYPAEQLILWLVGMAGIIVFVAVFIVTPYTDPDQIMRNLQQLEPLLGPQSEEIAQVLKEVLPYFPAFFGLSWCFSMIINGALAQGILVNFKTNMRPSPSIQEILFPRWLLGLLAICVLTPFLELGVITQLTRNIALILFIPFALTGIGYVHKRLYKTPTPQFFIVFFYVVLLLFPWLLFLLALGGVLLNSLANKRK